MRAKLPALVMSAIACALLVADAQAQSGSRGSGTRGGGSGFTARESSVIRRQSVGNNFSSSALNRQVQNLDRNLVPRTGVPSVDRSSGFRQAAGFGGRPSGPAAQRPFSNISRRPSVSPFLSLFDDGFDDDQNAIAFQTIVQPQLQQQRAAQQFQFQQQQIEAQQAELDARVRQLGAQPAFNPTGSQILIPTGAVPSTFRFFGNYYPNAR